MGQNEVETVHHESDEISPVAIVQTDRANLDQEVRTQCGLFILQAKN